MPSEKPAAAMVATAMLAAAFVSGPDFEAAGPDSWLPCQAKATTVALERPGGYLINLKQLFNLET